MKYSEFLSRIQTIIGRMDEVDVGDLCNTIKEMIES